MVIPAGSCATTGSMRRSPNSWRRNKPRTRAWRDQPSLALWSGGERLSLTGELFEQPERIMQHLRGFLAPRIVERQEDPDHPREDVARKGAVVAPLEPDGLRPLLGRHRRPIDLEHIVDQSWLPRQHLPQEDE